MDREEKNTSRGKESQGPEEDFHETYSPGADNFNSIISGIGGRDGCDNCLSQWQTGRGRVHGDT